MGGARLSFPRFSLWLLVFQLSIDGFNYFDPAFAAASYHFEAAVSGPFAAIILLINSFFAFISRRKQEEISLDNRCCDFGSAFWRMNDI